MDLNNRAYSFFNQKSTVWIPIFLGILALTAIIFYLNFPLAFNQGIYHYQGFVMKNGGLPYTDFIEKKGPMGLLTYSLASLIFGESAMAYRIFDLLVLGIIAFFLFRLSRLFYSKSISISICVFWFLQILIDGPGNTGDVTNIITASYVALTYYVLAPQIKNRPFIAGILIALACWVKPTAILIGIPLLFLVFRQKKALTTYGKPTFQFLLGMGVPSMIFLIYLLVSNTFYGMWEVVVLDTVYNYAGHVSRFSSRVFLKTGQTLLYDPFLRLGGILGLFIFSKNTTVKCVVLGIGLMLFVEGRFFPYQFSILWPFLSLGIIEAFIIFSQGFSQITQKVLLGVLCILLAFPIFKTGSTFIRAGFPTNHFDAGQTFLIEDFKNMYTWRKPVVSYLKHKIKANEEIFVFGYDPNIYLELGSTTSCRLARDGGTLAENPNEQTPDHIINWQLELMDYLNGKKADWIILMRIFPNEWANPYKAKINTIFSQHYTLDHSTDAYLIYKKNSQNDE